jgi:hypothetical protein
MMAAFTKESWKRGLEMERESASIVTVQYIPENGRMESFMAMYTFLVFVIELRIREF